MDGVVRLVVHAKEGRLAGRRKAVARVGCDARYVRIVERDDGVWVGHGWPAAEGQLELAGRRGGEGVDGRVAVCGVPGAGRGRCGPGCGGRALSRRGVSLLEQSSKERHGGESRSERRTTRLNEWPIYTDNSLSGISLAICGHFSHQYSIK
jgi:hypothetical protein